MNATYVNSTAIRVQFQFPANTECSKVEVRAYHNLTVLAGNHSIAADCTEDLGDKSIIVTDLTPGSLYTLKVIAWSDYVDGESTESSETTGE